MPSNQLLPNRRSLVIAILLLATALILAVVSLTWPGNLPTSTGKALVGGPFTMVNHKGETVTEKSFAGKYMLLFFGFTFCPDVCPTELQVMSAALDQLGSKADNITPILVSVDPARDTPQVLASYVENFHPRLVGLTGTPEQVAAMAKAYKVFYAKVENAERPQDYLMDHSSILFLMAPDGSFVKHFSYSTDVAALVEGIKQAIE